MNAAAGVPNAQADAKPAGASPRVRVRPEPELLWSAVAVGFMGMAALMYAANAVWLVVCLVVALVGGGTAANARRLRGLSLEVLPTTPFTAGAPMALSLRAVATSALPDLRLEAGGTARGLPVVTAGTHLLLAPLPPLRRGIHQITRLRAASAYPLGVVRCERWWTVAVEVVVAPAPAGEPLPPGLGGDGDHGGGPLPEDLAGHRPYRPGDPVRGIDWRAAARGQGWLSTVWDGRGGGLHCLRFADCPGSDEQRLAQLARWIDDAHHAGLSFGLDLPAVRIEPGAGDLHRQRCLRALAAFPGAG